MKEKEMDIAYSSSDSISKVKKGFYFAVKRIFDIFVSLIGVIFLVPIYILIRIAYMFTGDFHGIIYSHNRVGKDGKIFKLYKFRSMTYNADEELKELLKQKKYRDEWNEFHKLSNDPRITKVGSFIREHSIDETPQFLNILIGDLSLIGPRPLIEGELDAHKGNHKLYESVRPGITGWWAVNGRSATTYKKRLDLEYYYVKNCCFKLDLRIIFKTVKVMFNKDGAK